MFDPTASSCFHSGHPRSGQIIICCLGGSRAAGSVPNPLRSGLWMQITLSFLSNTSQRKPIPKAAVWRGRTVRLNAAKWLNYKKGNSSNFKGHLGKMMLFLKKQIALVGIGKLCGYSPRLSERLSKKKSSSFSKKLYFQIFKISMQGI